MKTIFKSLIIEFSKNPNNYRLDSILILLIIVISTALLSINIIGSTYEYRIGDIAREDIRVPSDIQYLIESETEMRKKRILDMAPLVFDRDQSVLIEGLRRVENLFSYAIDILKENPPIGTDDRTFQLIALKSRIPKHLKYSDKILLGILKSNNPIELKRIIDRIMIFIFDRGILEETFDNSQNTDNKNVTIRTINISEETNEISKRFKDLKILNDIRKELYRICYSISPNKSKEQISVIYKIVRYNIKPNLKLNIDETRRRIDEAFKNVKPIMGLLKKDQILIREGDTITKEVLGKIDILNKHSASIDLNYIIGVLLLQLILILISMFYLIESYHNAIPNNKSPIMIFTLIMFYIIYTFFLSRAVNIENTDLIFALLLPIPLISMTTATIFNNKIIAMFVGIYVILFTFIISLGSFSTIIIAFSSTILGIIVIRKIKKRTDFLIGGVIIGLINSVIVIAIGLMEGFAFYKVLKNIELSLASGVINSIVVMGIFPLYESLFGITTRFKLLELSDLNAPIFKKMLIDAPGTYNHSLIVANMAESACEAIGANSILARVGGYYHDIGKIGNAEIFVENKADNHVQDLSPEEYSRLIISHVERGIELAKESRLPESIIGFIREHHGKSTMTYFYHQALEIAEGSGGNKTVDRKSFEYSGPKPQSKETAIVMLSDSIEAASRSLQEPNYIKLEGLVKKIIYNKLNEGELEHSNLNMSELNMIQKAILQILNGVFHTRIEYPEDDDVKRLEESIQANKENGY